MEKIGILGGMSYQSTIHYYEAINRLVNQRFGANVTADLIIDSGNFQEMVDLMNNGDWEEIAYILAEKAVNLNMNGADKLVIATNTMHKVADEIEKMSGLQVIHIADCVSKRIKEERIKKVGLLGTKTTMVEDFIKDRIKNHGIEVVVPKNKQVINNIDGIIFKQLCIGKISVSAKDQFNNIIREMIAQDEIEGLVLGCTELGMIIKGENKFKLPFTPNKSYLKVFDTTEEHTKEVSKIIIDSHVKKLTK